MASSSAPPSAPVEPKRIRQFRTILVKELPKFPNDRTTRDALLGMSLGQLLIYYCNWRLRFIRPAVRTVTVDDAVTSDPRYVHLQPAIAALLSKVRNGEDLTSHLSLSALEKGFTLAATAQNQPPPASPVDRWADKDFLLNVMGFHHFHLGTTIEAAGHAKRTNEVLFARVTRDTFDAALILDHSVFDVDASGSMPPERSRLWAMFDQRISQGIPAGTPFISTMIATSGHPVQITMYSGHLAKTIHYVDDRLNDREYVKDLYGSLGIDAPNNPKLSFAMNGLDLGLFEKSTREFWILQKGWI